MAIKHIQIIAGKMRYLEVEITDTYAVPPGTELIKRETIDSLIKASGKTEDQLMSVIITDQKLKDERVKAADVKP